MAGTCSGRASRRRSPACPSRFSPRPATPRVRCTAAPRPRRWTRALTTEQHVRHGRHAAAETHDDEFERMELMFKEFEQSVKQLTDDTRALKLHVKSARARGGGRERAAGWAPDERCGRRRAMRAGASARHYGPPEELRRRAPPVLRAGPDGPGVAGDAGPAGVRGRDQLVDRPNEPVAGASAATVGLGWKGSPA